MHMADKTIKNPLRKRILRDIRKEKGKYISIFLFLTFMISIVSGMLVTSLSMMHTYDDGIETYKLEDGHFSTNSEISVADLQKIADQEDSGTAKATIYKQYFYNFDYTFEGNSNYSIRLYENREALNTYSVFEGHAPEKDGELAIDRLFAENNNLKIGDTLTFDGKDLTICGTVAVPDYSCLFENNSDSMFSATTFTTGFVTADYFKEFSESKLTYSFAYRFSDRNLDDRASYDASTDLMNTLSKQLAPQGNYLTDFLMRQNNKAISFTREDMDGDTNSTVMMLYIMIALLAFIFALMTFSTIESEAGAIGTLRASGYTKGEIIRHYMAAPTYVFLAAAVIGNIGGYTCFRKFMEDMYYHSYSLPVFKVVWNANAFLLTTVIPIVILLVINYLALRSMLGLSPLNFLRHDLSKRKKKHVTKLPDFKFLTRFRIRTILQNRSNYITMAIGILMANILFIFSASMLPILNDQTDNVLDHLIANYQYTLKAPVELDDSSAEKYCLTALADDGGKEVLVYGIADNSKYLTQVSMPAEKGDIIISKSFMKLNNYKVGDTIKIVEKYGDKEYSFRIAGSFNYPAAFSVFMSIDNYNDTFGKDADYFTGYFSDKALDDLDDSFIYSTMGPSDYSKLSDQMNDSMGRMMPLMKYLSLIIFVIVIYLLSKIVLEKNAESISLTKILGYNNREIGKIYIISTAIAVLVSVAISLPLSTVILKTMIVYLFRTFDIWLENVHIGTSIYVQVVIWDIVCYGLLSFLQYKKIRKIPMEEALKNRE